MVLGGPSKLFGSGRGAGAVGRQGQNRRKLGQAVGGDKDPVCPSYSANACWWLLLTKAHRKTGARKSVKAKHRRELPGCGTSQRRAEKVWATWRKLVDKS